MATGWGRGPWSSAEWGSGDVVQPDAGAVVLAGVAPSLVSGTVITPAVGAIALAGVAPIIMTGTLITPTVGALTLVGVAPTVAETLDAYATPPVGALTLVGKAPMVQNPNWIPINPTQTPSWQQIAA